VTNTAPDWQALQAAIAGGVVLPGSLDYDSARKPAMARFYDARPQAIVLCETPGDVSETISFARQSDLRTVSRSGGHCFAGRSSTGGIVIDVAPMRSVSVSGGVATVGAGARLGEVYDALDEHGLTIPAGCGPDVGISGLTLSGGLGILGRKHGLTSDHLIGAQVVLADGRVVERDEHRDEELLWALRGAGGGNFGVVTSLDFGTLPTPAATSFRLIWPDTHATTVVEAWQDWSPAAPDELSASLLLTASSDAEEPPVVNVFGAMLGTESDTEVLLDELVARVGADPTSATLEHAPYRETKRYLAEHGPGEDRPTGTSSTSRSSSGNRYPPKPSRRWSRTSTKDGSRASRASWTSRPGPAPTTASAPTPRPLRTETSSFYSCTWPSWTTTPRPPKGRPRGFGWGARGRACVHGAQGAFTRTFPTPT
jgi:FAD/FMN-containing dehydrogenase